MQYRIVVVGSTVGLHIHIELHSRSFVLIVLICFVVICKINVFFILDQSVQFREMM